MTTAAEAFPYPGREPDEPDYVYLPVPHYSQLDETLGIEPAEARRLCAIVCMKTVLEFKKPGHDPEELSVTKLKNLTLANGGKTEDGWKYAAEVRTLQGLGLTAWRRNWLAPAQDPQWLVKNEGYTPHQVAAINHQVAVERSAENVNQKATTSIVVSLHEGNPVIISMKPGFNNTADYHQVVVHGYDRTLHGEHFLITDPLERDVSHQTELMPTDQFFSHFKHQAIFVA